MSPKAQPAVSLSTRVPLATDERRRRLQDRTGYAVSRLVDEAFRSLERDLDRNRDCCAPESAN
jgi:hypothetical protein